MEMSRAAVDDMIRRLLLQDTRRRRPGNKTAQAQAQLAEGEIRSLCAAAKDVLMRQPNLVELDAPIHVCGDVHGQYRDLLRIFDATGGFPPRSKYLFLGDYVDRGDQSLETICLLLAYKVRYPETLFLLRGNHECASINRIYGFYDECKRRYSVRLWRLFSDCFNCLPVAALVDGRVLCVHGGLSPHLRSLDQIRRLPRPCDVPHEGLLCDLLWSDPSPQDSGWADNEDRGVSCTFGADVVVDFLRRQDLDLVCRAHQVVEDGYEFFADRQVVTVFSAPNYCGEFDNDGAVMSIDADLVCSFTVIKPEATDSGRKSSRSRSRSRSRGISISSAGLRRTSSAPPPPAPSNNSNRSTRKGLLRNWQ